MAESTTTQPTPAAPETPSEQASKRNRSGINKNWIRELNLVQNIVASALKPEYLGAFTEGGIDAPKLNKLNEDIKAAQLLASAASQKTTSKEGMTEAEADAMNVLIELIQEVQKRAKQKYAAANPTLLKDFAVGRQFYSSRPVLEQTTTDILAKLATDTLPGINAAKARAIQTALEDYRKVQSEQATEQSSATTGRKNLESAVADIVARRREIQFAADAQWPHTDKANAGIRAEFQLPPNRAMK